jgi:2-oxoacid:acceptor oxidoreductase gamma subunit (pyruvate/2-ketoisovalerate family)
MPKSVADVFKEAAESYNSGWIELYVFNPCRYFLKTVKRKGGLGMKEIRLHGIGGLGTVKAGEIIVHAAVMEGKYGNSIPFFGFERQGAPVTSFVRLDDKPIRPKNQVYHPNCVIVLEPSVMNAVDVFDGLQQDSFLILNTKQKAQELKLDDRVKTLAYLDATAIALDILGRPITNTIMLGAFAKATQWVDMHLLEERVMELFGEKNVAALKRGYESVIIEHR